LVATQHVWDDELWFTPLRWILVLPFLLCKVLQKSVEPFVHPRPLAFIAVHNHRKKIVAHLVDDYRDQPIFRERGIGSILFRSGTIEANHGIFHSPDRTIDTDGDGVGIIKGITTVHVECVDDGVRTILAPKRFTLVGEVAHGHDFVSVDIMPLRVPNEFAARSKGKITNIFGMIDPSLRRFGFTLFVLFGLFCSHDEYRLFGRFGLR
jgi:hypothetical protein